MENFRVKTPVKISDIKAARHSVRLERPERDRTARKVFNPFLYENIVSNVEAQIERWVCMAEGQPDAALASSYRLKAEGLAYALRLLAAFEDEFP